MSSTLEKCRRRGLRVRVCDADFAFNSATRGYRSSLRHGCDLGAFSLCPAILRIFLRYFPGNPRPRFHPGISGCFRTVFHDDGVSQRCFTTVEFHNGVSHLEQTQWNRCGSLFLLVVEEVLHLKQTQGNRSSSLFLLVVEELDRYKHEAEWHHQTGQIIG